MTIEAQKQNYDVPAEILKTAKERADYSKNYLAKIKKSPEDFAKEVYAVFGIKFDAATNEGLTRGVFELQKKLSMNANSCDAKLGKNTYGMYVNKIGTQFSEFKDRLFSAKDAVENGLSDASKGAASIIGRAFGKVPVLTDKAKEENEVKFEQKEFIDAVTGYKVLLFVPEGADGSTELFFNGQEITIPDTLTALKTMSYLQEKWRTGARSTYAIIEGKNSGKSPDKYEKLSNRNALTSILNGLYDSMGVRSTARDVVLSGWSRGASDALARIQTSGDPALQRVIVANNLDGLYSDRAVAALAKFARENPTCQVNLAFQDVAGSATRSYGRKFMNIKMAEGLKNVDIRSTQEITHKGIAREFSRIFSGLMASIELNNKQKGIV